MALPVLGYGPGAHNRTLGRGFAPTVVVLGARPPPKGRAPNTYKLLVGEHAPPHPLGLPRRVGAKRAPTLERYRSDFNSLTGGVANLGGSPSIGVNTFAPQAEGRGEKVEGAVPPIWSVPRTRIMSVVT